MVLFRDYRIAQFWDIFLRVGEIIIDVATIIDVPQHTHKFRFV